MQQRDILMKNAIDTNNSQEIKRLIKQHQIPWADTRCIQITHNNKPFNLSPLYYAVSCNAYDAVVTLVTSGVALNNFSDGRQTEAPLHKAVYLALPDIIKYLLVSGANIDLRQAPIENSHQYTPLHITAHYSCRGAIGLGIYTQETQVRSGREKIAKLLLRLSADPALTDGANMTAVQAATCDRDSQTNRPEIIITIQSELTTKLNHNNLYQQLAIGTPNINRLAVFRMIQTKPKEFLSVIREGWQLNKWQYAFIAGIFSTPIEACALMKPLAGVERLKTLDLSNKGIDDTTVEMVIWLLNQNCFLRELDLQNNTLTSVGLGRLSEAIVQHPQLELINIQHNPAISSRGVDDFLTFLSGNYRLLSIHLPNQATQAQAVNCNTLCNRNAALAQELIARSREGNVESVQQLLQQGVNTHHNQETALVQATDLCHVRVVELLVKHGANSYVQGVQGRTAYGIAEERSDPAVRPNDYGSYLEILHLIDENYYIRLQLSRRSTLQQARSLNIPLAQLLAQFGQFIPAAPKQAPVPPQPAVPKGP